MRPESCQFLSPVCGTLLPYLCPMERTTRRGTSGRAGGQLSVGELLDRDEPHSSELSSGRSNILLIENELFSPHL